MNTWESVEMAVTGSVSSGKFLILPNDGDSELVMVLGDPFAREVVFIDGRYVNAHEAKGTPGAVLPFLRISINVAIFGQTDPDVRIFEMSSRTFKELCRVRDRYGLDNHAFRVTRHGVAGSLLTTYSFEPEVDVSPHFKTAYHGLPLHDLPRVYGVSDEEDDPPPPFEENRPPEPKGRGRR